jgi:hypothetical protein
LILSDITVMGPGYCVIGLEQVSFDLFRSIRPMPPGAFAWREPFPYQRGARVKGTLTTLPTSPPHTEDRQLGGLAAAGPPLSEHELVQLLLKAEVAVDLEHLFGCPLNRSTAGGNVWVDPDKATRSICGCLYENIRFRVVEDPERLTLRAQLLLASGERLNSLPVVDREWRRYLYRVLDHLRRSQPNPQPEAFLNRSIRPRLLAAPQRLVRLGLARPTAGKCWVMLDSLFPQPQISWLEDSST